MRSGEDSTGGVSRGAGPVGEDGREDVSIENNPVASKFGGREWGECCDVDAEVRRRLWDRGVVGRVGIIFKTNVRRNCGRKNERDTYLCTRKNKLWLACVLKLKARRRRRL